MTSHWWRCWWCNAVHATVERWGFSTWCKPKFQFKVHAVHWTAMKMSLRVKNLNIDGNIILRNMNRRRGNLFVVKLNPWAGHRWMDICYIFVIFPWYQWWDSYKDAHAVIHLVVKFFTLIKVCRDQELPFLPKPSLTWDCKNVDHNDVAVKQVTYIFLF